MKQLIWISFVLAASACSAPRSAVQAGSDLAGLGVGGDLAGAFTGDLSSTGCGGACAYTVYAHSDHVLYTIDVSTKMLVRVGPFLAPKAGTSEDVITDLAVAPDDTIYAVSHTKLYTASPTDGHVTSVGSVTACGMDSVALTTTPDGNLFAADYKGAFCRIDLSTSPPTVKQLGTLGGGYAIAGDLVAVADGTMYGSAYKPADSSTANDNLLVKIDPATGAVVATQGPTHYPQLYGVAYAMGQVFGFTHDGSGDVVIIDPQTGSGSLFNTFLDPATQKGISFAGAGVNSMVAPTIN